MPRNFGKVNKGGSGKKEKKEKPVSANDEGNEKSWLSPVLLAVISVAVIATFLVPWLDKIFGRR